MPRTLLENVEHFRALVDFVTTPSRKAEALLILSEIFAQGNDEESRKKRLEVLQEVVKLIFPPQNDSDTTSLFRVYWHILAAEGQETERRKPIVEALLKVEDDSFSNLYGATIGMPLHPFQPADIDLKLYERARAIVKESDVHADNLRGQAQRWTSLLRVTQHLFPSDSEERKEAFGTAFKAAMEVPNAGGPPHGVFGALSALVPLANNDEISDVLDELVIDILDRQRGRAALQFGGPAKHILREYVRSGNTDRMLELIYSNRLPYKDRYLYFDVAHALLDADAPPDDEFRADDFKKMFDMVNRSRYDRDASKSLTDAAKRIPKRFSWYQTVEEVQAIPDPVIRLEMCLLLIAVHCEQSTGVDVMPFLDYLERNIPNLRSDWFSEIKVTVPHEMLVLVQRHSLWEEVKITDWMEKYEAAVAEYESFVAIRLPANQRFSHLYQLFDMVVKNMPLDDEAKNAWLDKLLVAARDVREPNLDSAFAPDRIDAFAQVTQQARDAGFPDRARAVIDEALAYGKTISPAWLQDSVWVREKFRRLELVRDALPE
ncbi:MAG: hypothetical protein FWE95_02060 [Planctomycetaceae bacterium]|nr:hypothetical protein [Planctomycetaceae bacterium]